MILSTHSNVLHIDTDAGNSYIDGEHHQFDPCFNQDSVLDQGHGFAVFFDITWCFKVRV